MQACSFRLKDYCFGTLIKERVRFMCSVLVLAHENLTISAHGLKNELDLCVACSFRLMDYCFGTLIKERVRFMCSVLVSVHGLLFRHMD